MAVFKRVIGLTSAIVSKGTGPQQKTVSRALTIHSAWCTGGGWSELAAINAPVADKPSMHQLRISPLRSFSG